MAIRRTTSRSTLPFRKRPTPPKPVAPTAPDSAVKRLNDAYAAWHEADDVARAEPEWSAMADMLSEAASDARETYEALCASMGVCRADNCMAAPSGGKRLCKRHEEHNRSSQVI